MATVGEVLSSLSILTSNSTISKPTGNKQDFDEVLLSNLERLKATLDKTDRFVHLQEYLEGRIHRRTRRSDFVETKEVCDKEISETVIKEPRTGNVDWDYTRKDIARWHYVETCLELLLLLKESLILAKSESGGKNLEAKHCKRGVGAPPLPADSLGVGDQKTVLTVVQFVVILGICPNLLPGVGLAVEKRSGFASLLKIQCSVKNEKRLFKCVDTLVECIAQPSLGSLVLSRHLGDILSGLLQICYAPVTAYLAFNSSEARDSFNANNACDADLSRTSGSLVTDAGVGAYEMVRNQALEDKCVGRSDSELRPNNVYELVQSQIYDNRGDQSFFITASDREKCVSNLQRILDRVYQPVVVRELLFLQCSPKGAGKQGTKYERGEPSVTGTPKWMRNVCGQLLSERLMKPNGVKAVLFGVLEESKGDIGSADWQKCDAIAKVIANCPSQATSVEGYYKLLSPQVVELLHGENAGVGRLFVRAACSVIRQMLTQYPELAEKLILHPILEPLAKTTGRKEGESGSVFVNEAAVMRCIEDIHKVFVVGSHTSGLPFMSAVIHPLFELFCFVRKRVSHLRSALQEILAHVIKHSESHDSLTVLYTLAFKQSPPEKFVSAKSSLNANSDGINRGDKGIQISLMSDDFFFANGDNGGVVIKVVNDNAEDSLGQDDVLRIMQGDGLKDSEVRALCIVELLSGLMKDNVAGHFFIHLMQELTNVISDFSEDLDFEGVKQSLLILHLVALMCEKLGPTMVQNIPQTLAFIQATLKRACLILHSDHEGLGTAFITHTISMSLGMLSAVLGGTVELKKEHRLLVQDLVPLLATLADSHPSTAVKDMANDLRISIATHGAVWSHKTKNVTGSTDQQTDITQLASGSTYKEGNQDSKSKDTVSPHSHPDSGFDKAFSQLCDPFLPVRGQAIMKLASLLRQRDPKAMDSTDTLLNIFLEQLAHEDSYIYLAAVRGLVSLADIRGDTVIPRLAREFAICRKEASRVNFTKNEDKEKGCYMPSGKVPSGSRLPARSPELRMKLGEALVKATRNCGEMVPKFSQHLLPALLTGVKDSEPLVRASSLSNLGDVCQLLRFSLGPVVNEIFSCLSAVLKTDKSPEVRRAAVLVITLLLRGLGKSIMEVLGSTLKEIYQLLKLVESTDADDVTRGHALAALGELDTITRDYLFPKPSFTKQIQVLP